MKHFLYFHFHYCPLRISKHDLKVTRFFFLKLFLLFLLFLICVYLDFYCYSLVKNRKEAKRIAMVESLATRKARIEELKRHVQDQRAKRDEYAEILFQQSSGIPFNCISLSLNF